MSRADDSGSLALLNAVATNNYKKVQALISDGIEVNYYRPVGLQDTTSLISTITIPSESDSLRMARLLLNNGANPNFATRSGLTPLLHAGIENKLKLVQLLLKRGAKVDYLDSDGSTCLMCSVQVNNIPLARILIQNGASINMQVSGLTALGMAVLGHHHGMAKLLIKKGADVNVKGLTPLIILSFRRGDAIKSSLKMCELLIENGAYLDRQEESDKSVLEYAVTLDFIEHAKLFIKKGASLEIPNRVGDTPLMVAILRENLEMVQLLVGNGANVTAQGLTLRGADFFVAVVESYPSLLIKKKCQKNLPIPAGFTGLMAAVHGNRQDVARVLLARETNLDAQDENGGTALMVAATKNRVTLTKVLIKEGANTNLQNSEFYTALMLSTMHGSTAVAELLVRSGADLDLQDNDGYTALMCAALFNKQDIVRLLVEAGADLGVTTVLGSTARDLVTLKSLSGDAEVVQLLMEEGSGDDMSSENVLEELD